MSLKYSQIKDVTNDQCKNSGQPLLTGLYKVSCNL